MKKLFIVAFLFLGLSSHAQIGNLYIYNFSSVDVHYQLLAAPVDECYPTFSFRNQPDSAGFIVPAGELHTFNGFFYPTTPNFPSPPAGGWRWLRTTATGSTPAAGYTETNAQALAGNVTSAIQARWRYFKCVDVNSYNYAGIGFSDECRNLPEFHVSYTMNFDIIESGGNTIVTINDN